MKALHEGSMRLVPSMRAFESAVQSVSISLAAHPPGTGQGQPTNTPSLQVVAKTQAPAGIAMEVNVLTSGYWPTYPVMDANLPPELALGQEVRSHPSAGHQQ